MKRIIYSSIVIFICVFMLTTGVADAAYPYSSYVSQYYNNTVHSDGVYYGRTNQINYIRGYNTALVNVVYQPYPVYYDVPVYYPQYQKPQPVCNDYRRGARYYENSDQGPNCNDRIEDWNNRQGLPNEFLAGLYGSDNY